MTFLFKLIAQKQKSKQNITRTICKDEKRAHSNLYIIQNTNLMKRFYQRQVFTHKPHTAKRSLGPFACDEKI